MEADSSAPSVSWETLGDTGIECKCRRLDILQLLSWVRASRTSIESFAAVGGGGGGGGTSNTG